jgi:hypothetical protein
MTESAGRLRAGVAGVDITPDRSLFLEGYGNRTGPATGTRDRLEARAIVFDDGERRAALVSADLCGIQAASTKRIRALAEQATGIPAAQIAITYTHTHSGPYTTTYLNTIPDPGYLRWLEETIAELIVSAAGRLQPVTIGTGEGSLDFTVNRRTRTPGGTISRANPHGVVDRRVRVLRLDPADAPAATGTLGGHPMPQTDPVALLFSYACHATVLRGENYRYSGDYPGEARRFVEQALQSDGNQAAALFLAGCSGNLRPDLRDRDGSFRSGTEHELTVLGRRLGSEAVGVAERIASEPVDRIGIARREVKIPYARVPDAAELRAHLDGPLRYWATAMLERLERDGSLPESEVVEVQVLRLGRHWIVALPGETTLEIGLAVERCLADCGLADPARGDLTLALGYANDYVAYLCSASIMTEGGYEPTSWAEYLRCGPFSYELEGLLVGAALDLATELAGSDGG